MRSDGRTHNPNEPARRPDYRRLYLRTKVQLESLHDAIARLYDVVKDLRERLTKLETRHGNDA
jgi:hypothetical protein